MSTITKAINELLKNGKTSKLPSVGYANIVAEEAYGELGIRTKTQWVLGKPRLVRID